MGGHVRLTTSRKKSERGHKNLDKPKTLNVRTTLVELWYWLHVTCYKRVSFELAFWTCYKPSHGYRFVCVTRYLFCITNYILYLALRDKMRKGSHQSITAHFKVIDERHYQHQVSINIRQVVIVYVL